LSFCAVAHDGTANESGSNNGEIPENPAKSPGENPGVLLRVLGVLLRVLALAWVITVLLPLAGMVAAMWVELLIRSPA
jgi:hypothetical protein